MQRLPSSSILVLLAGCFASAPAIPMTELEAVAAFDPDWYLNAVDAPSGHDHRDPAHHANRSTPNFDLVSYAPITSDHYGVSPQDYGCGSTTNHNGRRLAVVSSFMSDVAFFLYDLTDVAQPRKVGELVMMNVNVYDITMTPDQRYVLIASNVIDSGPDLPPLPPILLYRDACSGETKPLDGPLEQLPYMAGIIVVDIRSVSDPKVVDFRPMPLEGGHSIQARVIRDRTLILLTIFEFVHEASYFALYEIQETPAGPRLMLLSIIPGIEPDGTVWGAEGVPGVHDGYLGIHPLTGQALAYLATGPTGIRIYNIDDPRNPRLLGQWKDFTPFKDTRPPTFFFHSTLAMDDAWEGKHYTFTSEECPSHRAKMASCLVVALDTTDPSKPRFAGAWAMPADAAWEEIYEFSTHHIAVHERTLFVSLVHGGLWAVDVSGEEALRVLPSIGAFVPTNETPTPTPYPRRSAIGAPFWDNTVFQHTPCVLDVDVISDEGHLLVTDTRSGIYVVTFDASRPAPAPPPWPLGYNQ